VTFTANRIKRMDRHEVEQAIETAHLIAMGEHDVSLLDDGRSIWIVPTKMRSERMYSDMQLLERFRG
jgi:hypothetical protein